MKKIAIKTGLLIGMALTVLAGIKWVELMMEENTFGGQLQLDVFTFILMIAPFVIFIKYLWDKFERVDSTL